ncbi:hypothetical protein SUGI_0237480 [Cryptomeria japonica]|nr:hypothetical protein SUGI_0237480 [Cryptomeria japonica]
MDVEREKKLNGWNEALQPVPRTLSYVGNSTTLQLLERSTENSPYSSSSCGSELIELDLLELGQGQCHPFGWEKCLDLKTGAVYYLNSEGTEERSEFIFNGGGGKLDLELNLSTSKVVKTIKKNKDSVRTNDSIAEEAESVMRLVGCQRCLMYFMVCGQDAKCPKCNGCFLLDFLQRDSISE